MAKKNHPPKPSLAERVKRDPKLLDRALRDPGLRSKLPDKYLTPEQRKARRGQRFRDDIGDLGSPLSGDTLVDTAQTLVDREFDPLEQDIGREEKSVTARRGEQQRRAAGYYGDLGRHLAATVNGQVGANAGAVEAAGQRSATALGIVDQSAGAAQQRAAQDAAVRGAATQGDAMAELAGQQAQARMRAATEGQAATDQAQAFGQAQEAFLRGVQGATMQAGGEVQGQIGARGDTALGELAASRAKLRSDRKGAFTDTLLKMRGSEVERTLTERGLANDQEKAVLDYKTEIASLKTKAQIEAANRRLKLRLTEMGLDEKSAQAEADRASREAVAQANNETSASNNAASNATSRDNNAATNAQSDRNNRRSNGPGGLSHKDRVTAAGKRDDAISMADSYKKRRASRDTALSLLTQKYGSDYARVAVGAIYDGGAKPHLEALLKERYGIGIPRQYKTR